MLSQGIASQLSAQVAHNVTALEFSVDRNVDTDLVLPANSVLGFLA